MLEISETFKFVEIYETLLVCAGWTCIWNYPSPFNANVTGDETLGIYYRFNFLECSTRRQL